MLVFGENAEMKFLERTIRFKSNGIEWEGDTRHSTTFISLVKKEFCSVIKGSVPKKQVGLRSASTLSGNRSGFTEQTSELDICQRPPGMGCSCLLHGPGSISRSLWSPGPVAQGVPRGSSRARSGFVSRLPECA